jgi:protoporphyrinogen IX oxidase
MLYLSIKTLHLLFVTSWFVGLFYLPRILVNMAQERDGANNPAVQVRLELMARRLLRFTTILAGPALLLGLWLWLGFGIQGAWLWLKLALVAVVVGYHHSCYLLLKNFLLGRARSSKWYRIYNEVPVIIMLCIIALVMFKPAF